MAFPDIYQSSRSNGVIVLENKLNSTPVIKEKTAFYMNQMLQNVVTNGTGVNARLSNMPAAGKTGTTDDDYDRWFAGYTSYYTAVVWYGFDQNKTIVTKSGTSPAVPLWKAVMEKIHNLEPGSSSPSGTLVKASYCSIPESSRSRMPRRHRGSRVATGTFFNGVPTGDVDYIISTRRQGSSRHLVSAEGSNASRCSTSTGGSHIGVKRAQVYHSGL